MPRPPYRYRPPSPDWIRRQIQRLSWPEALYAAYRDDDVSGLCKYLRSEFELDAEKRGQLAALLERRVQKRPLGRRPGIDVTFASEAERDLLALARAHLRQMQRANNGRVPDGGYELAVELAASELGEDGYLTAAKRAEDGSLILGEDGFPRDEGREFNLAKAVRILRRSGVSQRR